MTAFLLKHYYNVLKDMVKIMLPTALSLNHATLLRYKNNMLVNQIEAFLKFLHI
jgi:hypothetical protein